MTDQELKDIVAAVVAELEKSGVDFDYKADQAKDDDLVFVIRGTAPNYQGVTVTWKGLLDIITAQATQAKNDAVTAKNTANTILEQVQSKGTEITNFVATSKAELETQKNESVNAVKSVYQTDLDELKGDLDTERNARIEADTDHSTKIQKNRYEIDNLKAKAEGKLYRTETVEAEAYTLDVPSSVAPYAEVQKIGGKSVVWNQIIPNYLPTSLRDYGVDTGTLAFDSNENCLVHTFGDEITNDFYMRIRYNHFNIAGNYQRYCRIFVLCEKKTNFMYGNYSNERKIVAPNVWTLIDYIVKGVDSEISGIVTPRALDAGYASGDNIKYKWITNINLTKIFGVGNEPTLEECQKIFSADYYPYDAGTLKSFPVRTVRSINSEGTEIGSIDLSSFTSDLKSAVSVHDEWSNGKIIRRVGSRSYTSGDESESNYITDGTTTYYPLDTPTEETVSEIDNYINVEGGGTLTFESDDTVHMPVPSTDRFVVDLT